MTPKSWSQIAAIVCVCSGFVEGNVWILVLERIAEPWGEAMWAFRALGMFLAGLFIAYGSEQSLGLKKAVAVVFIVPSVLVTFEVVYRLLLHFLSIAALPVTIPVPEPWSVADWWWRINCFASLGILALMPVIFTKSAELVLGQKDQETRPESG